MWPTKLIQVHVYGNTVGNNNRVGTNNICYMVIQWVIIIQVYGNTVSNNNTGIW